MKCPPPLGEPSKKIIKIANSIPPEATNPNPSSRRILPPPKRLTQPDESLENLASAILISKKRAEILPPTLEEIRKDSFFESIKDLTELSLKKEACQRVKQARQILQQQPEFANNFEYLKLDKRFIRELCILDPESLETIEAIKKVLEKEPKSLFFLAELVNYFIRQNQSSEAIEAYSNFKKASSKSKDSSVNHTKAILLLALSKNSFQQRSKERLEEALEAIDIALKNFPSESEEAASEHEGFKPPKKHKILFTKASALSLLSRLSDEKSPLGKLEKALEAITEALELEPNKNKYTNLKNQLSNELEERVLSQITFSERFNENIELVTSINLKRAISLLDKNIKILEKVNPKVDNISLLILIKEKAVLLQKSERHAEAIKLIENTLSSREATSSSKDIRDKLLQKKAISLNALKNYEESFRIVNELLCSQKKYLIGAAVLRSTSKHYAENDNKTQAIEKYYEALNWLKEGLLLFPESKELQKEEESTIKNFQFFVSE